MAYGKSKLAGQPGVETLEIESPDKTTRELLERTANALKQVANRCVWTWLTYHDRRQTLIRMQAGLPAHPCPPELCARWLRDALAMVPSVHCSTVLAVTNWLAQTITRQDSPRVNDKRWRCVLRCDENAWSFRHPLPIRLWNGNAKIVRLDNDRIAAVVRLDRIEVPGRRNATSTETVLVLRRPKQSRRAEGHSEAYAIAAEIADGKRALAQSQLIEQKGKWLLRLTVAKPIGAKPAARTGGGMVIVRPGRLSAVWVRGNGERREFGDSVLDKVSSERLGIDRIRRSCMETQTHVPKRVSARLEQRWYDQSTAMCHAITDELVSWLSTQRYERVLWLDGNNRTCALALAGKNDRDTDLRELFPFERMRRLAERKFQRIGVEFVGRANFRSAKRRAAARRRRREASQNGRRSQNGSAGKSGKRVATTG